MVIKESEEQNKNEQVKATKHYHTLERLKSKSKRKDIYRCIHPDCTFYGPAHLLEGKHAICKLCYTRFVLDKKALSLKIPHCGCRSLAVENLTAVGQTTEIQTAVALKILKDVTGDLK
jgi:hypothetical protein